MSTRDLLAIVAAIVYAGDGLEAAVIAATINAEAEERPEWNRPEAGRLRDGATPRLEPAEAVTVALELIRESNARAWQASDTVADDKS